MNDEDYVYLRLQRPEEYENVCPQLVIDDFFESMDFGSFQPEECTEMVLGLCDKGQSAGLLETLLEELAEVDPDVLDIFRRRNHFQYDDPDGGWVLVGVILESIQSRRIYQDRSRHCFVRLTERGPDYWIVQIYTRDPKPVWTYHGSMPNALLKAYIEIKRWDLRATN